MNMNDRKHQDNASNEHARPSRILVAVLVIILLSSLALFGVVEILNTTITGRDALCGGLRHAATALLVGSTIALIFELVIQRRASKASESAVGKALSPIKTFLSGLEEQLQKLYEKTEETVELSHVMTVAQHTGITDIFTNRSEAFNREIKQRVGEADIKRILMVGVSLRDFFAGDAPLYETMTALNERIRELRSKQEPAPEVGAIIMRGDCADADLRITIEEGTEFRGAQMQERGENWREKSRLWSDYKRVTDSWELHFGQIELREFDHLPTGWVLMIESNEPAKSAVYVEQYHYGRRGPTNNAIYSCLGGKCPVLKYGHGDTFEIFKNHLETMFNESTRRQPATKMAQRNGTDCATSSQQALSS